MPGPAFPVLLVTMLVVLVMIGLLTVTALAAEPTPTAGPFIQPGDPRSDGGGPGIIGSPLGIIVAVMALGLATAALTALLARLSQRD